MCGVGGACTHGEVDLSAAHLTVMGPKAPVWPPDQREGGLGGASACLEALRDFTPASHRQGNRLRAWSSLDHTLLPAYRCGNRPGPLGGSTWLVLEFWQRPVGGFSGIWFGFWKSMCVWMVSARDPVLWVASETCHACFQGAICHLCARTGGVLPTFLGVTPPLGC